jgi:hypothetical protein
VPNIIRIYASYGRVLLCLVWNHVVPEGSGVDQGVYLRIQ